MKLLFFFFAISATAQDGVITISQQELDNPVTDTLPLGELHAYSKYWWALEDTRPVEVQGHWRKDSVWVEGFCRALPKRKKKTIEQRIKAIREKEARWDEERKTTQ